MSRKVLGLLSNGGKLLFLSHTSCKIPGNFKSPCGMTDPKHFHVFRVPTAIGHTGFHGDVLSSPLVSLEIVFMEAVLISGQLVMSLQYMELTVTYIIKWIRNSTLARKTNLIMWALLKDSWPPLPLESLMVPMYLVIADFHCPESVVREEEQRKQAEDSWTVSLSSTSPFEGKKKVVFQIHENTALQTPSYQHSLFTSSVWPD